MMVRSSSSGGSSGTRTDCRWAVGRPGRPDLRMGSSTRSPSLSRTVTDCWSEVAPAMAKACALAAAGGASVTETTQSASRTASSTVCQRERSDALTGDGAEGDGLLETCGFGIGVGERGGEAIARLGDSRVEAAAGDGWRRGELDAELGGFALGDRLACRSQSVDFGIVVEHLQRDPGAGLAVDERVRAFDSVLDRRRIVVGVGIGVEHGDQLAAAPPVVGSVGRAADCQRSGLDGEPIGVGAGKVVGPVGGG